jgi:ATP-dependent Lon protease
MRATMPCGSGIRARAAAPSLPLKCGAGGTIHAVNLAKHGAAMSEPVDSYPILPLKNTVVYPNLAVPLSVGRARSMAALKAALDAAGGEKRFVCVAQRDAEDENPEREGLHDIGTLVSIRRVDRKDDGAQVFVQGIERVTLHETTVSDAYLGIRCTPRPLTVEVTPEVDALARENLELGRRIAQILDSNNGRQAFRQLIESIRDPVLQAYRMAQVAQNLDLERQQEVLAADSSVVLLKTMHAILTHELQVIELRKEIASQAAGDIERAQREQLLRQQKRTIEQALGEDGGEQSEVAELRRRLQEAQLPDVVRKEAERECRRMERMSHNAADFQVARTYLELILELPWTQRTEDNLDLANAERVLDEDHFGLEDVKERILEFLAVMKLNPQARAPILCFVGPPGVGKTSLGQSIARAIGRKFERLSLGGMHDEAELRGHRRTYIGAMPGRILQAIRRAGVVNPVLMLDEVDKLGRDFRGDPAAALMEILDPAQNAEFRDNYLNLPFDLSQVFFVTTANTLDTVPRPLLDRMEILQLSGYSQVEKLQIARRYLIPRQTREAGLDAATFAIDDDALSAVVQRYTREAGVRELERTIARLARKVARRRLAADATSADTMSADRMSAITAPMLSELLGPERFFPEKARRHLTPGVAPGLAYTEAGGDVLYVEASLVPKDDRLTLTGQLGDVMQESAKTARSLLWRAATTFGIDPARITDNGVHIHVPAGAVPKDGPSAGVTLLVALASLYAGEPVAPGLAMTGEITLTGLVLPVGGIREKVLSAHRCGITTVILPKDNAHDLAKLPAHVREAMTFELVETIEQVLARALPKLLLRPAAAPAAAGRDAPAPAAEAPTPPGKPALLN